MVFMIEELTLVELAAFLGMQPRTIRSYIEQGLLRGPEVGGRGARYTTYHVQRLKAIQLLKDLRGLPLAEVRRRLLSATGPELARWAEEADAAHTRGAIDKPVSALNYIRRLQTGVEGTLDEKEVVDSPTPMDVLLARLSRLTKGAKTPSRRSRGEAWTSVPVTPDIEIRVRGVLTIDQISRWERIADHFREILMNDPDDD
jgi:DNA-binding transcriptional MerR regulator